MSARLIRFLTLPLRRQVLLAYLWTLLGLARFKLLHRGLSHFTAGLTLHEVTPCAARLAPLQMQYATELGQLVALAARYTPWHSSCLTQVLLLQYLLRKRRIPGSFSLGVRRDSADGEPAMKAHAWLQCGGEIVNGESLERSYVQVSTFSWGL